MKPIKFPLIMLCILLGLSSGAWGFDLQGHRGARGLLPENTLAAFARALSIGVNTLEMDLGVSKEGVVVVTHNPRLAPEITRDSKGEWLQENPRLKDKWPAIHALTLPEIKTFDVGAIQPGSKYKGRFPEQTSVTPSRIPTLAEVFGLIKRSGNKRVRLNLETKIQPDSPELTPSPQAFIAAILKVVREQGFEGRITIQSFDWRTLREAQRVAPSIPTSYLTVRQKWFDTIQLQSKSASPWMAGFHIADFDGKVVRAIKAAGGRIWSPFHREVNAGLVKEAHEAGLQVKVWTVNKAARMRELIDMGVDGIITDYPHRLREVLKARGLPLPKPTPVSP